VNAPDALARLTALEEGVLANWLRRRREQLARGELAYIAHQMDFLVRIKGNSK